METDTEVKAFNEWFEKDRRKRFAEHYPNEPFRENWSMGYKNAMMHGWLARASVSVGGNNGNG